jgi:hypothetical protein
MSFQTRKQPRPDSGLREQPGNGVKQQPKPAAPQATSGPNTIKGHIAYFVNGGTVVMGKKDGMGSDTDLHKVSFAGPMPFKLGDRVDVVGVYNEGQQKLIANSLEAGDGAPRVGTLAGGWTKPKLAFGSQRGLIVGNTGCAYTSLKNKNWDTRVVMTVEATPDGTIAKALVALDEANEGASAATVGSEAKVTTALHVGKGMGTSVTERMVGVGGAIPLLPPAHHTGFTPFDSQTFGVETTVGVHGSTTEKSPAINVYVMKVDKCFFLPYLAAATSVHIIFDAEDATNKFNNKGDAVALVGIVWYHGALYLTEPVGMQPLPASSTITTTWMADVETAHKQYLLSLEARRKAATATALALEKEAAQAAAKAAAGESQKSEVSGLEDDHEDTHSSVSGLGGNDAEEDDFSLFQKQEGVSEMIWNHEPNRVEGAKHLLAVCDSLDHQHYKIKYKVSAPPAPKPKKGKQPAEKAVIPSITADLPQWGGVVPVAITDAQRNAKMKYVVMLDTSLGDDHVICTAAGRMVY